MAGNGNTGSVGHHRMSARRMSSFSGIPTPPPPAGSWGEDTASSQGVSSHGASATTTPRGQSLSSSRRRNLVVQPQGMDDGTTGEVMPADSSPRVMKQQHYIGSGPGTTQPQRRDSLMSSATNSPRSAETTPREGSSSVTEDAVKVVVRVRPMNDRETRECSQTVVSTIEEKAVVLSDTCSRPEPYAVHVDRALGVESRQEDVFETVGLPMVDHCIAGFNSTIFAYGQTGSGKTYTMMGTIERSEHGELHQESGLIPRVFEALFAAIAERERSAAVSGGGSSLRYSVKCSFLEIYNEEITDLLDPSATGLQIRDGDAKRGVYVQGLSETEVLNADDVLALISSGSMNRTMAATKMNDRSSRSHSVFTATIEAHRRSRSGATTVRFSKLNLIDLAGSERVGRSGATGDQLTEAKSINRSLTVLGRVISALVDRQKKGTTHVPYRDSRLTFLLQESLGGNSRTAMVATVTPAQDSAGETYCTLAFAAGAKKITCRAVINEDRGSDVKALQAENARLLKALEEAKKGRYVSDDVELLSRELEQARSLFDQNNEVITSLRAEQSILRRELMESKAVAARAIEEASTLRASNVSLNNAYESLEEENAKLTEQIGSLLEQIACMNSKMRDHEDATETLTKEYERKIQHAVDEVKQFTAAEIHEMEIRHTEEVQLYEEKVSKLETLASNESKAASKALEFASEAQTTLSDMRISVESMQNEIQERTEEVKISQKQLCETQELLHAAKLENAVASQLIEQMKEDSKRIQDELLAEKAAAADREKQLQGDITLFAEKCKEAEEEISKLKLELSDGTASVAKYKRMVGEIGRLIDWAQAAAPGSAAATAAMAAASAMDTSRKPSPAAQAALRVARMSLTSSGSGPLSDFTNRTKSNSSQIENSAPMC